MSAPRELLEHHRALIGASGIAPDVALERGYFSARKRTELADLGFASFQRIVPALVVPIHGVHGEVVNYQCRPDTPRVDGERGRAVRYETVANGRMTLDVPPRCRG